ncbi:unnamed protein product, partial [Vitis vinifera]|uniref:Uncharacterized protein n=1 Tax=Vitis vinifera TaxID=29760 RepID=D7SYP3_VITVI
MVSKPHLKGDLIIFNRSKLSFNIASRTLKTTRGSLSSS